MPNVFGKGIQISTGFDLGTSEPLDHRTVVTTYSDLGGIPSSQKYQGLSVYVEDDDMFYRWTGSSWETAENTYLLYDGVPDNSYGNAGYLCIDTKTGDLYKKIRDPQNNSLYWDFIINIIGPKGDKGDKGAVGSRGSKWFRTSTITGEEFVDTIYPNSDISSANVDDIALNITTGNIYICHVAGGPDVAKWSYQMNLKGAKGDPGPKGDKGDTGATGAQGIQGAQGEQGIGITTGTGITGQDSNEAIYPDSGVSLAREDELYFNTNTFDLYQCIIGGDASTAKWVWLNNVGGNYWYTGTAITGTSTTETVYATGITFAKVNDLYLNTNTGYIYCCTELGDPTSAKWVYKGTVKGKDGSSGVRGSLWYTGTAVTGTSTTGTVFATGIGDAKVNDLYLNTDTGYTYRCTVAGKDTTAKWVYNSSIHGKNASITTIDIVLEASKWTGASVPYSQVIQLTHDITDKSLITPVPESTYDNIRLISDAYILATNQDSANNRITFQAFYLKPSANIKYTLHIVE